MVTLTGSVAKYPARASFFWYAVVIGLGGLILTHPVCRTETASPIRFLDGLFTATSATCVTGLSVRSTEYDFSFWGQLVILLLIQIGGIGIMTITTYAMSQLGNRQTLRQRSLVTETLGTGEDGDLRKILRSVLLTTLIIELTGFLLLLLRNLQETDAQTACWRAAFHSISAFCNAGFALHDKSLMQYQGDVLVNLTIDALIILGGLGFPVLLDLYHVWPLPWGQKWSRLRLHSKVMFIGTAALLALGTISFLVLEEDGVLRGVPLLERPMVAFFHAVTCRTAGFNTVEVGAMTDAMLFISILMMMIGAGPGSTAGGFKVSTTMVLVLRAWATVTGHNRVSAFHRTLPRECVERATTTLLIFIIVTVLALTTVLMADQYSPRPSESSRFFLDSAFECASALGTVGLSTGITPYLSDHSRIVIILLMFLGRLGPISVFAALSRSEQEDVIEYPGEEPLVG